jgi:hypothetical protein
MFKVFYDLDFSSVRLVPEVCFIPLFYPFSSPFLSFHQRSSHLVIEIRSATKVSFHPFREFPSFVRLRFLVSVPASSYLLPETISRPAVSHLILGIPMIPSPSFSALL